jgi:hypothetical protein
LALVGCSQDQTPQAAESPAAAQSAADASESSQEASPWCQALYFQFFWDMSQEGLILSIEDVEPVADLAPEPDLAEAVKTLVNGYWPTDDAAIDPEQLEAAVKLLAAHYVENCPANDFDAALSGFLEEATGAGSWEAPADVAAVSAPAGAVGPAAAYKMAAEAHTHPDLAAATLLSTEEQGPWRLDLYQVAVVASPEPFKFAWNDGRWAVRQGDPARVITMVLTNTGSDLWTDGDLSTTLLADWYAGPYVPQGAKSVRGDWEFESAPFSGNHSKSAGYAKVGAGESMQATVLIPALPGEYTLKPRFNYWTAATGTDSENAAFAAELTFD